MRTKHIIFCPKCGEELYLDAASIKGDFLVCKNKKCFTYFEKLKNTKVIRELGSYNVVINDMLKKGVEPWPGVPTSTAYKPNWVKLLDNLSNKK
ncbi:hypothetical protein D3C76_493520 [compost metagenome]